MEFTTRERLDYLHHIILDVVPEIKQLIKERKIVRLENFIDIVRCNGYFDTFTATWIVSWLKLVVYLVLKSNVYYDFEVNIDKFDYFIYYFSDIESFLFVRKTTSKFILGQSVFIGINGARQREFNGIIITFIDFINGKMQEFKEMGFEADCITDYFVQEKIYTKGEEQKELESGLQAMKQQIEEMTKEYDKQYQEFTEKQEELTKLQEDTHGIVIELQKLRTKAIETSNQIEEKKKELLKLEEEKKDLEEQKESSTLFQSQIEETN